MKICIIGVGNIGMRYVQGIAATLPDAELLLIDNARRLKELDDAAVAGARLFSSLSDVDEQIDLFVIATSCGPRLSLYKQCLERKPGFVILEKYLFAGRDEFDECLGLPRVTTFVNQWMHGSKTFDPLFKDGARSVELSGSGWGLACNAVHWIDVFKKHLDIASLQVGDATTVSDVVPAKRPGYEEIHGQLVFVDRDSDKTFTLTDEQDGRPEDGLRIKVDEQTYWFSYTDVRQDDRVVSCFPYFSELIGGIVADIMSQGRCSLPPLGESISQHLLMEDILETLDRRPNIT